MSRAPSIKLALLPIIFLVILLSANVIVFKDDCSYGPNQLALFMAAMLAAIIGKVKLKMVLTLFKAADFH